MSDQVDTALLGMTPEAIARFESKIRRGAEDECWPWLGKNNEKGGVFNMGNGRSILPYRLAYMLVYGPLKPRERLRHTCHLLVCCNVLHIELGSAHPEPATAVALFWPNVDRRGPDECWPWLGDKNKDGYGQLRVGGRRGRMVRAHRLAYELLVGPIPTDRPHILHSCPNGDRPDCVNPAHLRPGTHKENMEDKAKRGKSRNMRGEANGRTNLTEDDVRDIRRRAAAGPRGIQRQLAREFGLKNDTINRIVKRHTWGHVE